MQQAGGGLQIESALARSFLRRRRHCAPFPTAKLARCPRHFLTRKIKMNSFTAATSHPGNFPSVKLGRHVHGCGPCCRASSPRGTMMSRPLAALDTMPAFSTSRNKRKSLRWLVLLNAMWDKVCAAPALEAFSNLLPASTKIPMDATCPPLSEDATFTPSPIAQHALVPTGLSCQVRRSASLKESSSNTVTVG